MGEIFNEDVTVQHNTNTGSLATFTQAMQDVIKEKWDKFKAEKDILDLAALDSAVTTLTTQLNTYINT